MHKDTEKGTGLKYWKGKSICPDDWKNGNPTTGKKGENEQVQFVQDTYGSGHVSPCGRN